MAKKKKQSRLRRIVSALNPTNPKGMALLFALIFALSGAGVYLYQSFAATGRPPYACGTPRQTLNVGSKGNCVKYVQWALNNYWGQSLTVDGDYGAKTSNAVKALQYIGSLPVDGVMRQATWERLDASIMPANNGTLRAACTNIQVTDRNGNIANPWALSSSNDYAIKPRFKNVGNVNWQVGGIDSNGNFINGNVDERWVWMDVSRNTLGSPGIGGLGSTRQSPPTVRPGNSVDGLSRYDLRNSYKKGTYLLSISPLYKSSSGSTQSFGADCEILLVFN